MIGRYPRAEKFVFDLLHELCPAAEIHPFYNSSANSFDYRLDFEDSRPSLTVRFGGDRLDDLEEALKRNGASPHDEVLRNAVRFTTYISLGRAGLMPRGFPISEIFVKERGDWKSDLKVTTKFDDRFTRELAEGLEKLRSFLEPHLDENEDLGEGLEALRSQHERIVALLQYYQKNGYLNDSEVSTDTLTFFKAAIIAQLIEKETRRIKQPLVQIRAAIDREIYTLVEELRNTFFLHVPLPSWFSEYREIILADSQSGQPARTQRAKDIEAIHVFLSHKHDDVAIADAIKQCFEKFGIATFVAHRDIVPSAIWRRTILEHLQGKCNVFAPILTGEFHASLWTDQETGIAVQNGLPILPVKVHRDPYGFIDDRQAVPLKVGEYLKMCVGLLVGLGTQHSLFSRAAKLSFAKGLQVSQTYDEAGLIAESLSRLEPFSAEEATAILQAVIGNRQVHESGSASRHLAAFLSRHEKDLDGQISSRCSELLTTQSEAAKIVRPS